MRVVHCVRAFSPLSQTFIYDYVVGMQRQGAEVHVLTDRRENAGARPFSDVHVVRLPSKFDPARVRLKLRALRSGDRQAYGWNIRRMGVADALRRLRPDVVHAHFGPEAVRVLPVTRALGIPLVVTFYGYDVSRLGRDATWIERYRALWQHAAAVIVLSAQMRDALAALGCPPERCTIVRLGKDLGSYEYSPRRPPLRRLLSVGRLVEKKGHLDAVRAMRALRDSDPDVQLTIVGDGPLRAELAAHTDEWGLRGRVTLAGALSHADVMAHMRSADAFVLASRTASDGDQEGTPTVLIEAQAMGLACITTRHAGIPEQIPAASQWLLVEEGDAAGIAERIRSLRACPAAQLEAMARAGRRKMEQEFNVTKEVAKLIALYEGLHA